MSGAIIDAITHAVAAVRRRADGLPTVAARHTKASAAALARVAKAARGSA